MVKPGTTPEHLVKAADFAGAARLLLDAGRWERAVSSSYYAVFHLAQALLASVGQAAETHGGVLALVAQHFVKDGPLPSGASRLLSHLQTDRLLADYGVRREITKSDAIENAIQASDLIDAMLAVVEQRAPGSSGAVELRAESGALAASARTALGSG